MRPTKKLRLVGFLIALVGAGTTAAQDAVYQGDPVAIAAAMVPQAEVELRKAVDRELAVLNSYSKLSKDAMATLNLGLTPLIKASSAAVSENGWMAFMMGDVPPGILKTMVAGAEHLAEDKEAFAKYKTDLESRDQFRHDAAYAMFMNKLEKGVGIRSKQALRVETIARKMANEGLLPSALASDSTVSANVLRSQMKDVLTESQFAWWKKNAALTQQEGVGFESQSKEVRSKSLRGEFGAVAAARIEWLQDEFKLTPKQVAKLQLAAKGAISKLVDDRIEARDALAAKLQNGPGEVRFDTQEAALAMVDKATLLLRFGRWRKLMLSTLTEEQQKAFRELESRRNQRNHEGTLKVMVLSFGRTMEMNAKQHQAFRDLMAKHIPAPSIDELPTYAGYSAVTKISAADYIAAIGEDNWEKFKPTLAQMRLYYGGNEQDEDDDQGLR